MKIARSWLANNNIIINASSLGPLSIECFWEHRLTKLGNIRAIEDNFIPTSELYALENVNNVACWFGDSKA